jgi:uncharacterized glyoxalase superfamily protein PhnB
MAADVYGRSLPPFTVNLIVAQVDRSVAFYRDVLGATVLHFDTDFAALRLGGVDFMLHADHTYKEHPWHRRLAAGEGRGLGTELRAFGLDPDAIEARARANGVTIIQPAADKPHGWRETMVTDPDGYVWAVGRAIGG